MDSQLLQKSNLSSTNVILFNPQLLKVVGFDLLVNKTAFYEFDSLLSSWRETTNWQDDALPTTHVSIAIFGPQVPIHRFEDRFETEADPKAEAEAETETELESPSTPH